LGFFGVLVISRRKNNMSAGYATPNKFLPHPIGGGGGDPPEKNSSAIPGV